MLPLPAPELARILDGELINGKESQVVASISTDTRSLQPGALFIPLKGERFDGRQFISQALEFGAVGYLIDEEGYREFPPVRAQNTVIIKVKDTLRALQKIAAFLRSQLRAQVVGITGSTGKTSTKDMLASILSGCLLTVCSDGSHNNEIGVPLTLLRAEQNTEVVIVELAMRGLGQIKELAEIARPVVGVVTNVGKSHFEFLESEELIGKAKGELVEAMPPEGTVFLNADDTWSARLSELAGCEVITYGIDNPCDVRAEKVILDRGKPSFMIASEKGRIPVELPVLGRHNVYNALAAAAVALHFRLSLEDIKAGLEHCRLAGMRMEPFVTQDGVTLLNDAYNANPASMEAALLTLSDVAGHSRKIAVLGDMLELGSIADSSHYQVGELAANLGVDLLIAVGQKNRRVAEGALARGMESARIFLCDIPSEAFAVLRANLKPGDIVLVKGSRALGMEQVVDLIVESTATNASSERPR